MSNAVETISKIEDMIRERKQVAERLNRARQCADIGRTNGFYIHPIAHQGKNIQITPEYMVDAVTKFADVLADQLAVIDRKLMAVGAIVEVVNHVE